MRACVRACVRGCVCVCVCVCVYFCVFVKETTRNRMITKRHKIFGLIINSCRLQKLFENKLPIPTSYVIVGVLGQTYGWNSELEIIIVTDFNWSRVS